MARPSGTSPLDRARWVVREKFSFGKSNASQMEISFLGTQPETFDSLTARITVKYNAFLAMKRTFWTSVRLATVATFTVQVWIAAQVFILAQRGDLANPTNSDGANCNIRGITSTM
jgi:hypothetical protein